MQIKKLVEQRLREQYHQDRQNARDPEKVKVPKVAITGENYEVTGTKAVMSTVIGYVRLILFAFLFIGDHIFNFMGGLNQFPQFVKNLYGSIKENKF